MLHLRLQLDTRSGYRDLASLEIENVRHDHLRNVADYRAMFFDDRGEGVKEVFARDFDRGRGAWALVAEVLSEAPVIECVGVRG